MNRIGLSAVLLALGLFAPANAQAFLLWPDPTVGVTHVMQSTSCVAHQPLAIVLCDGCPCDPKTEPGCITFTPKEKKPLQKPAKVKKTEAPTDSHDALAICMIDTCMCEWDHPNGCYPPQWWLKRQAERDRRRKEEVSPKKTKQGSLLGEHSEATAFLLDAGVVCCTLYGVWDCRTIAEIHDLTEAHEKLLKKEKKGKA